MGCKLLPVFIPPHSPSLYQYLDWLAPSLLILAYLEHLLQSFLVPTVSGPAITLSVFQL